MFLAWLEKQGEQKSADETPYPETLEKAINLYYYSYGNGKGEFEHLSLEKFRDIVHTFVSDYGQNPAWSEEDEANLDYLIDFCNGYYNGNKPVLTESTARSLSNWLYRLKSCEIMSQTNKIDNEEAEKTIHLACEFIRHRMESNGNIGGVTNSKINI